MNFWPYCSTVSCSYIPVIIATIVLVAWLVFVIRNIIWVSSLPQPLYIVSWFVPGLLAACFFGVPLAYWLVGIFVAAIPVQFIPALLLGLLGGLYLGSLSKKQ